MISQGCAYNIKLGRDGEGSPCLVPLHVPCEFAGDEGVLNEFIPCPFGGGSEASLWSQSLAVDIVWRYVLETDDVLSLLGSFRRRGFLICDSYPIFEYPCGFCSSFELALAAGLPLCPQSTELGQFYILIYLALMVIPISAELVHGVLVVVVVVVVNSFGMVVDFHFGAQLIDDFLLLLGLPLPRFFLAFDRNIVNIHISHIFLSTPFLSLLSLFGQCFLLGHLYLLYQFLLVDDDRWFQLNHLHIGAILILIEDLPLVVLQSFLGVAVFGVDGSQSAVELLLSVFQFGVVDFGVEGAQGRQFLVDGLFLKVSRDGTVRSRSGVG